MSRSPRPRRAPVPALLVTAWALTAPLASAPLWPAGVAAAQGAARSAASAAPFGPLLGVAEALSAATGRPEAVNARLAAADAARTLERTAADPLALRPERVQAEQAAALAAARLEQARYEAYAEIFSAWADAAEAARGAELAAAGRDLAERALDIARIRFERGGATALDVQGAENDLARAERDLASAEDAAALARANLRGLTGARELEGLEPLPAGFAPDAPPTLAEGLANLGRLPALLQARQGVELARVAVELLDPSYAPRARIDEAELQLARAEEGAREARRGLELQVRSLHDRAVSAAEGRRVAAEALALAEEREALERRRLEAGLISEVEFERTALATLRARLEAERARHAYLRALFELQADAMTPVEGLDAF